MDYQTARQILFQQVRDSNADTDSFLSRLRQGKPPIPGQVTNILLALKLVNDSLARESVIERGLSYVLYILAYDSRRYFEAGKQQGVMWTPLLNEDLERIAVAVEKIFLGVGD